MYRNILLFIFLLWTGVNLKAQNAVPAVGGDATGSGGSAAYSIGQVVCTDISGGSGNMNQGVQQPYVFITTGTNPQTGIDLSVSIFPNPTVTFIDLKIENRELKNLSLQLMNAEGKLLLEEKIIQFDTAVKMDEYATGIYFLKVKDSGSELKTFKIIKN